MSDPRLSVKIRAIAAIVDTILAVGAALLLLLAVGPQVAYFMDTVAHGSAVHRVEAFVGTVFQIGAVGVGIYFALFTVRLFTGLPRWLLPRE